MPSLQQPLLVITDLDGSLLDHHTYRWDAAA
ncbi:MAG: mannosyl-3-phosphoglycerate phosphatase-related protein, partial [Pantoea sp.]|nr:mannosyl-3-phosphoglycerate phosphatase-related protein [Pantoea sp.]